MGSGTWFIPGKVWYVRLWLVEFGQQSHTHTPWKRAATAVSERTLLNQGLFSWSEPISIRILRCPEREGIQAVRYTRYHIVTRDRDLWGTHTTALVKKNRIKNLLHPDGTTVRFLTQRVAFILWLLFLHSLPPPMLDGPTSEATEGQR